MEREIWLSVVGFEDLYEVSNLGNVKSIVARNGKAMIHREKILKQNINEKQNGGISACVYLTDKNGVGHHKKVHQLVANAFVPNPEKLYGVRHIDRNPLNNRADNLEFIKCGIPDNGLCNSKISDPKTRQEICDKYNMGATMKKLASEYGVSVYAINRIVKKDRGTT